ncbi:zinc-binding dehydrogenase [Xanthobacter sp.]|uniref:quinone oxidoreductase family protein n=1 Tax=Xanthobacter sp. TaxID=35809 RepID=UPI0025F6F28B|nr:zinc-binding dehydrogenase [Xanthobacter sp.]
MKAVRLVAFGGPETLEPADVPMPSAGPGEVLLRVKASGVNFAETAMRQDRYALTPPLPSILGGEVAGIVEAVGAGVEGLRPGDRVAASGFAAGRFFGGYAEYFTCPAEYVTPLPADLSFERAVALMVQGLTALLLVERTSLAGKHVLVNAAAGGVGSLIVQLARRAGAKRVIAAASSLEKRRFACSLGADAAVDYTVEGWSQAVRDVTEGHGADVIYESVGGAVTRESLKALAPMGQIFIYGSLNILDFNLGVPDLLQLIFQNQSVTGFATVPLLTPARLHQGLSSLFARATSGDIEVVIGGIYPLAEAGEAHRALETRQTRGKLVLVP